MAIAAPLRCRWGQLFTCWVMTARWPVRLFFAAVEKLAGEKVGDIVIEGALAPAVMRQP